MAVDPLQRLYDLRALPRRLVIGLLSGTSADGTDAALREIEGAGEATRLLSTTFVTTPFERDLRERIFRLARADARPRSADIATCDRWLCGPARVSRSGQGTDWDRPAFAESGKR